MKKTFTTLMVLAGWIRVCASTPADSISAPEQELKEITVSAVSRKAVRNSMDGSIRIDALLLGEQPSFMGGNDPMALLRSLPAVQTAAELQPGIFVRGSGNGANHFESDGARIVNPMHLLGLYSAFNPAFYRTFSFRPGYMPPHMPSATGGFFGAYSGLSPDSVFSGSLSLGLIESHAAVNIPLRHGKSSISAGLRKTYLNLVFPDILKLGDSSIGYGFTDINMSYVSRITGGDLIKVSIFGNRDQMTLHSDRNGSKSGDFGWSNLAGSASWRHKEFGTAAAFTMYSNRFEMEEGGRSLNLPSRLWQATLRSIWTKRGFEAGADINMRHSTGMYNRSLVYSNPINSVNSLECNLSGMWRHKFLNLLDIEIGVRMSYYHCGSFNAVCPQPRLRAACGLPFSHSLYLSYGRLMRFDRLIEVTTGGLPADFTVCADRRIRPEDVHSFELGIAGYIPVIGVSYTLEGYGKILRHSLEFTGSLLDMTSPSFNPVENVADANGYAYGLSVTMMRQFGKIRGRIGYNWGRSRIRSATLGEGYFPVSHDRPHDLSVNVGWSVLPSLLLSANFTYATGTPYTKAKYGYMIGENLICEYYPHNSSRLPDYCRLDFSAAWTFLHRGRMRHSLNLSVYNAAASRNILFVYTDYSLDKGIRHRESVMKIVIPSISYILDF